MPERQLLLAAHNENIAACGDAERTDLWVASGDHAGMPASVHGVIDMREILDTAANILKDTAKAFLQRKGRQEFDQC